MAAAFTETARQLEKKARANSEVLVAYSGGKDSLAVLDLCCRAFRRVVAVHCYFVPGLKQVQTQLDFARSYWGVEILEYPAPVFLEYHRLGIFCNSHHSLDGLPKLTMANVLQVASYETGIPLIASGHKKSDSMSNVANQKAEKGIFFYPLFGWRNMEVLAYLAMRKIPTPPTDGRRSSSIDMTIFNLLWIYDNHREDFNLIERWFPGFATQFQETRDFRCRRGQFVAGRSVPCPTGRRTGCRRDGGVVSPT